jgi:hypothetical protein
MATEAKSNAALEAQIEKFRPKKDVDQPARGGTLYHLNSKGLLPVALAVAEDAGSVITRQVAWEVMADAQRRGVTF